MRICMSPESSPAACQVGAACGCTLLVVQGLVGLTLGHQVLNLMQGGRQQPSEAASRAIAREAMTYDG